MIWIEKERRRDGTKKKGDSSKSGEEQGEKSEQRGCDGWLRLDRIDEAGEHTTLAVVVANKFTAFDPSVAKTSPPSTVRSPVVFCAPVMVTLAVSVSICISTFPATSLISSAALCEFYHEEVSKYNTRATQMCGSVRIISLLRLEGWRLLLCAHKVLAVHVL